MPTRKPTAVAGRARRPEPADPEFVALIAAVESLLAEWTGPDPLPPHGVAHQDPRIGLLTWHLRGLPAQLDHVRAALRIADPAEVRLVRVLAEIALYKDVNCICPVRRHVASQ
ncbi:hypothetical protein [Micromonospora sp. WMMD1082]|uniref:hypothetical protein n=1 Tax=Micromonospora sp. WMMD1082 TaxID=3016104 RepID=UPI0024179BDF|nr:hypothetical protein [Micromonospora sp. WMMD1082]MDG4797651.1 hypothetical protein [Micromonospora sp. WMMD1082]